MAQIIGAIPHAISICLQPREGSISAAVNPASNNPTDIAVTESTENVDRYLVGANSETMTTTFGRVAPNPSPTTARQIKNSAPVSTSPLRIVAIPNTST